MKANERARIVASYDEWSALGHALGWTLFGWSDYRSASFFDAGNNSVRISGRQRDDILTVISSAANEGATL